MIISVETMLGCNLKCPECAIGANLIKRKKGYMPYEKFEIIADKVKDCASYMFLHIWGEALLSPDIKDIMLLARSICRCNISTNGQILKDDMAEFLMENDIDLIVSIDGVSQEAYEKYRINGKVDRAWNSVERLKYYQNVHKKGTIQVQMLVFQHNANEISAFENKCRALGVKPSLKGPNFFAGSSLQRHPSYNRLLGTPEQVANKCKDPTDVLTILLDGSCVACCYDYNGETNFGNIFTDSLDDIKKKGLEYRRQMQSPTIPKFCKEGCQLAKK